VTLPSGEVLSDGEDSESEANKQKKQQKMQEILSKNKRLRSFPRMMEATNSMNR
jgi:hypothetical protein